MTGWRKPRRNGGVFSTSDWVRIIQNRIRRRRPKEHGMLHYAGLFLIEMGYAAVEMMPIDRPVEPYPADVVIYMIYWALRPLWALILILISHWDKRARPRRGGQQAHRAVGALDVGAPHRVAAGDS